MNSPEPNSVRSLPPWAGRLARLLAVVLFLFIGWLTLPKLAPRMKRLFEQREARAEIARRDAHQPPLATDERILPSDVVLLAAVTLGGGCVLLTLAFLVLRRPAAPDEAPRSGQPPRDGPP